MEEGIFVDGNKIERTYEGNLKIGPYIFDKKGKIVSTGSTLICPDNISMYELHLEAEMRKEEAYSLLEKFMKVVHSQKLNKRERKTNDRDS
jgi:hypothetical protein